MTSVLPRSNNAPVIRQRSKRQYRDDPDTSASRSSPTTSRSVYDSEDDEVVVGRPTLANVTRMVKSKKTIEKQEEEERRLAEELLHAHAAVADAQAQVMRVQLRARRMQAHRRDRRNR